MSNKMFEYLRRKILSHNSTLTDLELYRLSEAIHVMLVKRPDDRTLPQRTELLKCVVGHREQYHQPGPKLKRKVS